MPKWYAKPNLCMVSFARPHGSTSSDDGGGDDGGGESRGDDGATTEMCMEMWVGGSSGSARGCRDAVVRGCGRSRGAS